MVVAGVDGEEVVSFAEGEGEEVGRERARVRVQRAQQQRQVALFKGGRRHHLVYFRLACVTFYTTRSRGLQLSLCNGLPSPAFARHAIFSPSSLSPPALRICPGSLCCHSKLTLRSNSSSSSSQAETQTMSSSQQQSSSAQH